jgi:Rha family phage regulatory protein
MQKQIDQTLTSLEIAELMGRTHKKVLESIRLYISQMEEIEKKNGTGTEKGWLKYFSDSTYIAGNGQEQPCYNVTKIGCEFLAHKLKGIKGTEFTIKYINRFHDMEEMIKEKESRKNTISLKEQLEAAAFVAEDLHVPQSNKIMMFRKVCENNHINSNFLPAYSEKEDREAKTATALLKQFQCEIKIREFNERMIKAGYLEERERDTSNRKRYPSGKKPFKALTEKGLPYGKNLTCEKNTKETQPYYYVDTFLELYHLVMQEVA